MGRYIRPIIGGNNMADQMIPLPTQRDVVATNAQTTVRLCRVHWTDDNHVRLFSSKDALYNYIVAQTVFTYTDSTPVAIGKALYRANVQEIRALHTNYIAFQNMPYDARWVYGFIDDLEDAGPNSCIIHFHLDVFQNNFYNLTIKPCFVAREHIAKASDVPGANLVTENVDTGDYTTSGNTTMDFGPMYICLYATGGTTGDFPGGGLYNGVYSGALLGRYSVDDYETVNELLQAYADNGRTDAVVAMFMAPEICRLVQNKYITVDRPTSLEGYTPENAKMLTYPYTFVMADNNSGSSAEFKFEHSLTNGYITFRSRGIIATSPAVYTNAQSYRHLAQDNNTAFINATFPMVSWSTDSFSAWLAQNKNTIALSTISSAVGVVGGIAAGASTGNPLAAVSGVVGGGLGIASTIAKIADQSVIPNQINGKVMGENINTALGLNRIDYYTMTILAENARVIDDYFTTHGYATNKVKTPNLRNRSSFNYVQTINCGFTGGTDLEALKKIRAMFDAGITLWHTNDIGNYSLSND